MQDASAPPPRVLTMVLAGGVGERLYPLTEKRCKPAMPFAASFRAIDFTLLNCLFSGFTRVFVLTQYKRESLELHCEERWRQAFPDDHLKLLPPGPERRGRYRGTGNAVYQHLGLLERYSPQAVLLLSGDHVYRADYQKLLQLHLDSEAGVTVLTGAIEPHQASAFGVLKLEGSRITRLVEKPANPWPFQVKGKCPINLGVYCFNPGTLRELLEEDATEDTAHDFGRNILPAAIRREVVVSCPLESASPDGRPYWRDIGTIDSFFEAQMDLLRTPPPFDLKDPRWPRDSPFQDLLPSGPRAAAEFPDRNGLARNITAPGVVLKHGRLTNCVISSGVTVGKGAVLEECILFPDATVEENVRLHRVIVEEGFRVAEGSRVGFGERAGLHTSRGGVTVLCGPGSREGISRSVPAAQQGRE
jgi:glucose-1-phosphate adenylyltransferase